MFDGMQQAYMVPAADYCSGVPAKRVSVVEGILRVRAVPRGPAGLVT